jgi:hypothetical protein
MKRNRKFLVGRFLNLPIISILLTSLVIAPMVLNAPFAMARTNNYSSSSQVASKSGSVLSPWHFGGTTTTSTTSTPVTSTPAPVTSTVASIALLSSSYTVATKGTSQFYINTKDQNGNILSGTGMVATFTSSNTSVATVGATSGLVTGVSAGTSVITATLVSGTTKLSDTATVTVSGVAATPTTVPVTTIPVTTTPVATPTVPVTTTPVVTTPVTTTPVVATPVPTTPVTTPVSSSVQWGAYVGDGSTAVADFDTLVGKKTEMIDDFEDFTAPFPTALSSTVGSQGKTLVVFWEPSTGLSSISNGSLDAEIKSFASGAKSYGYPVILVPFDEMNLNESAWGAGVNGNTPATFISAWDHIHDMFTSAGVTNVKFAIDYNNVSIPSGTSNNYAAYYPGANYVDIVGIDGYNFGSPWQTFDQVFSSAYTEASQFNKPIYLMAIGSAEGTQKAAWIDSLGTLSTKYPNVKGWTWFNDNKEQNWLVNSDAAALAAFKSILP